MSKNYCFPHTFDENGYPRIELEMSSEDYTAYCNAMDDIYKSLYNPKIMEVYEKSISCCVSVDKAQLPLISQDSEICKRISCPISGGNKGETLETNGTFQIIAYAILNYFAKDVSLEELTRIAVYGEWYDEDETWCPYLDVVCQAYGLNVVHESNWLEVYYKIATKKFLAAALIDHEMIPNVTGNSLVLITGIHRGKIEFFHPKRGVKFLKEDITHFAKHTRVLWGITG